jgi:hypothetical protein
MPLDRNAGGHRFNDGEKCEMTREQWDDPEALHRAIGCQARGAFDRRIARSISTRCAAPRRGAGAACPAHTTSVEVLPPGLKEPYSLA